jgi:hypothetical protein
VPFGGTGSDPGWFYRYECVPVEPTAEERAADEAEAAENADAEEIDTVMKTADRLAKGVENWTPVTGGTITADAPLSIHNGQIVLTSDGQVWYRHPGWYDDYRPTEAQITDDDLVARVRAILAGGDRRRYQYQVKTEAPTVRS